MKRWFCLILAALLIVPVLPVSAAAAEIYEFEYMEPIALYEDRFGFEFDGGSFYCPVIIPDGVYNVIFTFIHSNGGVVSFCASSVNISFLYNSELDCDFFSGYIPFLHSSGDSVDLFCAIGRGVSLDGSVFMIDYSLGDEYESPSVSLERVGDLPDSGDIGLSNFLSSVSTGLVEYSTTNLVLIVFAALILACSPLMAWFGYRFLKRKVTKSVFKGRL